MRGEAVILQQAWVKEHGPLVRVVGPFGIERLIVMKPEALQKILVNYWADYQDGWVDSSMNVTLDCFVLQPKFMRDALASVTGYGLLTVTGNEHKQMRKAMNPAFSIPNLVARESIDSMEG